jgi:hypothetical protein
MSTNLGVTARATALQQLKLALDLIKQADVLLDAAKAGWSVPDAPEQPPYIDALNSIKTQAAESVATATRLLATMGK